MFFKAATLAALAALASAAPVPTNSAVTGPGILLKNAGTLTTEYCFFNNLVNGDGWASPNFGTPDTCETLAPGAQQFVPLATSFKGRVTRTKFPLGVTYVEFQIAGPDNKAHGDVSIEQGSDGPATIASTDGTNQLGGFTKELVPEAPSGATAKRPEDGATVLASTMGNWNQPEPSTDAITWASSQIDPTKTYIQGGTGVDDVSSANQAFEVTFY